VGIGQTKDIILKVGIGQIEDNPHIGTGTLASSFVDP
jgi:hypothetical protein